MHINFKPIEYFTEITGVPWSQNERGVLLADRVNEKAEEVLRILDKYGVEAKVNRVGAVTHLQIPREAFHHLHSLIEFRKACGAETTLNITTLVKAVKQGSLNSNERKEIIAALTQVQTDPNRGVPALTKRSDLSDLERILQKIYDNCAQSSLKRFIKGAFFPDSTFEELCDGILQNIKTAKMKRQQNGKMIIDELIRPSPDLQKIRALIAAGADGVSAEGLTPLMLAAHRGHDQAVVVFIAAGADVNAVDPEGRTALYFAASEERIQAIRVLLRAGANVNQASKNGWTPLHWAAKEGYHEVAQILLAAGADPTLASRNQTPLLLAFKNGHHEVVRHLLRNEKCRNTLNPKFIAQNLIAIINILQDDSKFFIFKAAKEAPNDYVDQLEKEPELLKYITGAYPLTIPENSILHPLIIKVCDSGGLNITTTIMKPLMRADEVLLALSRLRICRFSHFHIKYLGSPGVDQGGLLRQIITQLLSGLIKQKLDTLKFNQQKGGGNLPEISPFRKGDEIKYLNTIGKLLAFALDSKGQYPIGDIFGSGLYALFLKLDHSEVTRETEEFIRNLSQQRMLELYQPLVDSDENAFSKLKQLLRETDIIQVRREIAYFVELGLLDAEFENDLKSAQKNVFEALRPAFIAKLSACHAIAKGLNQSLPLETIHEWEDLQFHTSEELSKKIQGVVNKETVKKYITVVFDNKSKRDQVKKWIDEWIDGQFEKQTIKNFLQVITGAPTVSFQIKFRLSRSPEVRGLNVHTCFNDIDVPATISKEALYTQLESWGRGEGIGEFTQS